MRASRQRPVQYIVSHLCVCSQPLPWPESFGIHREVAGIKPEGTSAGAGLESGPGDLEEEVTAGVLASPATSLFGFHQVSGLECYGLAPGNRKVQVIYL